MAASTRSRIVDRGGGRLFRSRVAVWVRDETLLVGDDIADPPWIRADEHAETISFKSVPTDGYFRPRAPVVRPFHHVTGASGHPQSDSTPSSAEMVYVSSWTTWSSVSSRMRIATCAFSSRISTISIDWIVPYPPPPSKARQPPVREHEIVTAITRFPRIPCLPMSDGRELPSDRPLEAQRIIPPIAAFEGDSRLGAERANGPDVCRLCGTG